MDDVVWHVINQNFCSYKVKSNTQNFCKNEEKKGILYLYMKTIERSHMPSKMWEKVKLSRNYIKALKQIDEKLLYWPNFLIYKNKARLTRLTQYLIKSKRLLLKKHPELVAIKPKQVRRETTRERKALQIAKLEKSIEKKLIERLKSGIYGENPLNVSEDIWEKILNSRKNQQENESELEYEDIEDQTEFFSDNEESDLEESYRKYEFKEDNYDLTDDSDLSDSDISEENHIGTKDSNIKKKEIGKIFQKRKHKEQLKKNKKAKTYIEIEYEQENQLTDKKI
ncbi:hypothetical protein MERGE_003125 [Pneumocystis wakefieldiae]|uniref:Protein MAK16 n=1 Tax=Pneumocystis wakefieldiae TaxID=38082 RepID=A0A899G3S9_9ASCO|nr:hypothetical protein MERGE_003125 [Pneumocystis wakefieldiae]